MLGKVLNGSMLLACVVVFSQCGQAPAPVAQGQWIKGTTQEQVNIIEQQFRGFDMAMVETGYRYQELYWAGKDTNWAYAAYQVEKIRKAITNGLARRPKRAASAQYFLTRALPQMQTAINQKDTALFEESITHLTQSCNGCHTMEQVPFFKVETPEYKPSPIR